MTYISLFSIVGSLQEIRQVHGAAWNAPQRTELLDVGVHRSGQNDSAEQTSGLVQLHFDCKCFKFSCLKVC